MAKIKNFQNLAVNPLRKAALEIAEAGLEAIDTKKVITKNVFLNNDRLVIKNKEFSLGGIKRIFIVGIGKCSFEAAQALEEILGKKISGGIILGLYEGSLRRLKVYKGDHPLPSLKNIAVTKEIIDLLSGLGEKDLVIMAISGGGSSLLCQPQNLSATEEACIIGNLMRMGADIEKTNIVRKHLSFARGGWLAKYAYPAKVISLIFSDVPKNTLEFVASGPTVKDTTALSEAKNVIKKYKINESCNIADIRLIETPKHDKFFKKVDNILFVSNDLALKAMKKSAVEKDFQVEIVSNSFSGEARIFAKKIMENLHKQKNGAIFLYGGESTVKVRGGGKGGRNQELVLSALRFIENGEAIISLASDGRDNTEMAGAICDIITKVKAKNLGLDIEKYLSNNDSYNFFAKTGDYLLTGDTGSNVSDLIIAIKG